MNRDNETIAGSSSLPLAGVKDSCQLECVWFINKRGLVPLVPRWLFDSSRPGDNEISSIRTDTISQFHLRTPRAELHQMKSLVGVTLEEHSEVATSVSEPDQTPASVTHVVTPISLGSSRKVFHPVYTLLKQRGSFLGCHYRQRLTC